MKKEPQLEQLYEFIVNPPNSDSNSNSNSNSQNANLKSINEIGIIKFLNYECKLKINRYTNKRVRLDLVDAHDGGHVATCTMNIPEARIPEGFVIIKDYSENEGMVKALMQAGVISKPVGIIPTGFVDGIVCKLLVKT